jgi:uncharacterized cupin superfamily protein
MTYMPRPKSNPDFKQRRAANEAFDGEIVPCQWRGSGSAGDQRQVAEWTGRPCSVAINSYPRHELFVITAGEVEIENADGTIRLLKPGDACFIPYGWKGIWRTLKPSKKTYITLDACNLG